MSNSAPTWLPMVAIGTEVAIAVALALILVAIAVSLLGWRARSEERDRPNPLVSVRPELDLGENSRPIDLEGL